MKARYILVTCALSFLVNLVSVFNVFLGLCSIFLLMLAFVPNLYIKLTDRAKQV